MTPVSISKEHTRCPTCNKIADPGEELICLKGGSIDEARFAHRECSINIKEN